MRRIGALIFPGFELLDVFGPMEMFGKLEDDFSLELVAETAGAIGSGQTLSAQADKTIDDAIEVVFKDAPELYERYCRESYG